MFWKTTRRLCFLALILILPGTLSAQTCGDKLDVVFVVDGTIRNPDKDALIRDWHLLRSFLEEVANHLFDKVGDLRIAQVLFARTAKQYFSFINDRDRVLSLISETKLHGTQTNIAAGLRKAEQLIRKERDRRPTVILLIFSGFVDNNANPTFRTAADARSQAKVVAVGVTNRISMEALSRIAGSQSQVIWASSFEMLYPKVNNTVKLMCLQKGNIQDQAAAGATRTPALISHGKGSGGSRHEKETNKHSAQLMQTNEEFTYGWASNKYSANENEPKNLLTNENEPPEHLRGRRTSGNNADLKVNCKEKLDLFFLVGVKAKTFGKPNDTVTNEKHQQTIYFLKDITTSLFEKAENLRVAKITFGSNARIDFPFSDKKKFVLNELGRSDYADGATNFSKAFQKATEKIRTDIASKERTTYILLITDRKTKEENEDTALLAAEAASEIATVFVIGIGNGTYDRDELLKFAGGNESRFLSIDSYYELTSHVRETIFMLCPKVSEKPQRKITEDNCRKLEKNVTPDGVGKCDQDLIEECQDWDILHYFKDKNCSCDRKPLALTMSLKRCRNVLKIDKQDLEKITEKYKDKPKPKSQSLAIITAYDGPVEEILEVEMFVEVLPRERMQNITIADIDNTSSTLFNTLPDPKKLAITRQTLHPLKYKEAKSAIETNFRSKRCGFGRSISVSRLSEPGYISLELALDMCDCSELGSADIPAKMNQLCKIVFYKLQSWVEFRNVADRICPVCYAYVLQRRFHWHKSVLADVDMKSKACDKIGNSFVLSPSVLTQWASDCDTPSKLSGCNGTRPSMMAYRVALPSPSELAICKDLFCRRLCSLMNMETDVIQKVLQNPYEEDMGCLTYLDGVQQPKNEELPEVNGTFIAGSCPLKSRVIKRSMESRHRRTKRSCSVTCAGISHDVEQDVYPPDVVTPTQIESCPSGDLHNCVQDLGEHQWNHDQAKAIYQQIRQSMTLEKRQKDSNFDLSILGYIGLGFSPEELATIKGITNKVYDVFGATHGWSPEQLRVLASRYLKYNNLQPYELDDFHLARMNHIVCGLTVEQVKSITIKAIVNATTILGRMQRCDVDVLKVLAHKLDLYHGRVSMWPEDHFSEFGILLAGVQGEDLKAAGTMLADHVTVPVVNHIPPAEFRKLSAKQTSLFRYEVSLALSQRGLCAWLTKEHKHGYLLHLCSDSVMASPCVATILLLSAILTTDSVFVIAPS